MKKIHVLFLLLPTLSISQTWEKTLDYGRGYSVIENNEGGYTIAGNCLVDSSYGACIINTDEFGEVNWVKSFDGSVSSIYQTIDGGYIVSGGISAGVYNDVYVIKTNETGDSNWSKTYGGSWDDYGFSVQQTIDGGYVIVGRKAIAGNNDVYLIKTDANGDTLWTKTYGGVFEDDGRSVQQTSDGGYIIAGSKFISSFYHLLLIKTDENGEALWTKTYRRSNNAMGYQVKQTFDGGYIVTGLAHAPQSYSDVYLIKTDGNGDSLWTRIYGGEFIDRGYSVTQNIDGSFTVAGMKCNDNTFNSVQLFLLNIDSYGESIWTNTYGINDYNTGYQVSQTSDEGFIIAGFTNDGVSDLIYLIKTDDKGIITQTSEIPMPNPKRKLIKTVDLSGKEILKSPINQLYIEIFDDGTTKKKMNLK